MGSRSQRVGGVLVPAGGQDRRVDQVGGGLQVLRPWRPGRPLHRQAGGAAQLAQGQLQGQAGFGGRDEQCLQGKDGQ